MNNTASYITNTTHNVSISITKEDREALNGSNCEQVMNRIKKEVCEQYDRMEYQKDKDFYSLMTPVWIERDKNRNK